MCDATLLVVLDWSTILYHINKNAAAMSKDGSQTKITSLLSPWEEVQLVHGDMLLTSAVESEVGKGNRIYSCKNRDSYLPRFRIYYKCKKKLIPQHQIMRLPKIDTPRLRDPKSYFGNSCLWLNIWKSTLRRRKVKLARSHKLISYDKRLLTPVRQSHREAEAVHWSSLSGLKESSCKLTVNKWQFNH